MQYFLLEFDGLTNNLKIQYISLHRIIIYSEDVYTSTIMIRVLSFIYRMIFWTWQATNPNILQTWPCVYKLVHPLYLLLCPPKMNWGLPPRLLLLLLFLLRPQKLNWTIQAWSWRILTVGIRMCKLYIVSIVDIACVIFDLRLLLIHTKWARI